MKIWFQNRRMKWRNCKERELLASGGTREQTLPNRNNPNPDLTDVSGRTTATSHPRKPVSAFDVSDLDSTKSLSGLLMTSPGSTALALGSHHRHHLTASGNKGDASNSSCEDGKSDNEYEVDEAMDVSSCLQVDQSRRHGVGAGGYASTPCSPGQASHGDISP